MSLLPKPVIYIAGVAAVLLLLATVVGFDCTYKSETTTIHFGISRGDAENIWAWCVGIALVGGSWWWSRSLSAAEPAAPAVHDAPVSPVASAVPEHQEAPTPARGPAGAPTLKAMLWRLARSPTDQKIAGVCGGIAEAADIPSWVVRVGFVIAFLAYGFGLFTYVVLWVCMPHSKAGGSGH